MTNYDNGAALERACKEALEKAGWLAVRSAGSKGKVDVLAVRLGAVAVVQCKRTGRLAPVDRAHLLRLAEDLGLGAVAVMAMRGPTGKGIVWRRLWGTGPWDFSDWAPGGAP